MLEWMFVGTLGGLGAVVLMGLEALNCLLTCRGKRRTRLLYAAAGLGIVLLLWWGTTPSCSPIGTPSRPVYSSACWRALSPCPRWAS